jgi:hypothetical protein
VHVAQRKKDKQGRIIAQIEDYRIVYDAFSAGLASLYGS